MLDISVYSYETLYILNILLKTKLVNYTYKFQLKNTIIYYVLLDVGSANAKYDPHFIHNKLEGKKMV